MPNFPTTRYPANYHSKLTGSKTYDSTTRIVWVDWMKAIAMFFIIAGHCWVPENQYIYVFSVPCFFIISGYLTHTEENPMIFWKKLFWNMVIPMLIYLIVNLCFYNLQMLVNGTFHLSNLYKGPLLSLIGMQGENYTAGGLKALWFVYTLCLCKIIYQYLPTNTYKYPITFLLVTACLIGCLWINHNGFVVMNSAINVLIAFPFFILGNLFRYFSTQLNKICNFTDFFVLIAALYLTYICGKYNGLELLYKCSYGNNLLLCIVGGISGTAVVLVVSKWCSRIFKSLNIGILGGGTLTILGLHPILIVVFNNILRLSGWTLYIESIFIFLLFIPINIIVKKYFPLAYGLYRK